MKFVLKELKLIFWLVVIPSVASSILEVATTSDSLKHAWWKLSSFEDFSVGFYYFLFSIVVYFFVIVGRFLLATMNWMRDRFGVYRHYKNVDRPCEDEM